jgi:glucose/arabinose dehydrogenase
VPESRELIIEWQSAGHGGGDMGFGPDGFLYFTAGDGTTGSDPDMTGQDLTDLRGSILRIDVDHPSQGKLYSIPKDNPFLRVPKARPEIWAFGLRAPWRMSFDSATGNLWVGEVGQDLWEMIHLIRRGGNYGWSVMEGTHPFYPERKIGPAPISPPIVEHHHSEARSITGGYVYHGKQLPELANHYLYCCYQTGSLLTQHITVRRGAAITRAKCTSSRSPAKSSSWSEIRPPNRTCRFFPNGSVKPAYLNRWSRSGQNPELFRMPSMLPAGTTARR